MKLIIKMILIYIFFIYILVPGSLSARTIARSKIPPHSYNLRELLTANPFLDTNSTNYSSIFSTTTSSPVYGPYQFRIPLDSRNAKNSTGTTSRTSRGEFDEEVKSLCQFQHMIVPWIDEELCKIGPIERTFISNFNELCPKTFGKFETKRACDIFITCNGDSLTINQCPPGNYFNKFSQKCMVEKMPCHKTGISDVQDLFNDDMDPGVIRELIEPQNRNPTRPSIPDIYESWENELISSGSNKQEIIHHHNNNFGFGRYRPPQSQSTSSSSSSPTYPPSHGHSHGHGQSWNRPENIESPPETRYNFEGRSARSGTFGRYSESTSTIATATTTRPYIPVVNYPTFTYTTTTTTRRPYHYQTVTTKKYGYSGSASNSDSRSVEKPSTENEIDCSRYDGLFPHTFHCHLYIQCGSGMRFIRNCAPGTLFNPDTSNCDWPHKVKCPQSQTRNRRDALQLQNQRKKITIYSSRYNFPELGAYNCVKDQPYKTVFPADCNRFIECENGRLFVKSCPEGTKFSVEVLECDHTSRVKCQVPVLIDPEGIDYY